MSILNEQQSKELIGLVRGAVADVLAEQGISQEKWFDAFLEKLGGQGRKYNVGGAQRVADDSALIRIGKIYMAGKLGQAEQLKTLTIGTDEDGGYVVPTEFIPELIQEMTNAQSIRNLVRVMPVSRQSGSVPVLVSGTTLVNIAEAGSYTPSGGGSAQPKFGKVNYNISKWGGIIPVSSELSEDAFLDIGRLIMDVFLEAARNTENAQCLAGTGGTSEAPAPLGIFGAGNGYIAKTAAATPGYDDLIGVYYGLGAAYRTAASWLMNTNAIMLMAKLKDDQKRPLFVPDPRQLGEFTILGKPVNVFDEIASVANEGTTTTQIGFGNWKSAYYLFDRRQLTMLSTNIGGDSFNTGTIGNRVDERFDGRPADKKAAVILGGVKV